MRLVLSVRLEFIPVIVLALLLALWPAPQGRAARDWLPSFGGSLAKPSVGLGDSAPIGDLEILVFEVDGCTYCEVMRRDVLPRYRTSASGAQAPMRFIDMNQVDTDKLALRGSVQVVPTVILMKNGKEVDRVERYFGPEMFFQIVARMIEQAR